MNDVGYREMLSGGLETLVKEAKKSKKYHFQFKTSLTSSPSTLVSITLDDIY
jgi:hypothetical protein